jgi:hypothetical protein
MGVLTADLRKPESVPDPFLDRFRKCLQVLLAATIQMTGVGSSASLATTRLCQYSHGLSRRTASACP